MKPLEFLKAYRKTILLAVGVIVMCVALIAAFGALGSAINEHQITKLEAEKQQALKAGDAARSANLILQGQVLAKDEQIKNLTSQLAESTERVSNAHNETQSARANLNQVRTTAPHFNSSDDAGRIREFSTAVRELYRDSPQ